MPIPSGNGSEVLKANSITNDSGAFVDLLGGADTVADHIYTILSVHVCNTTSTADVFSMKVNGTNTAMLIEQQSVGAESTYVHNDKIVIMGADDLEVWNTGVTLNYYVSYIDQDWDSS